jgi:hypothetical protein
MAELFDLSETAASNTARFPEGMQFRTVNDSARELEAMVARTYKDTNGSLTSGGSANAYTLTPKRTISALVDSIVIAFEANFTNTGAATLNVSGLGAKSILRTDGVTALSSGDIRSGQKVWMVYQDSGSGFWQMLAAPNTPPISKPQGRLTLTASTPVMTSSVTGVATVYYTPFIGRSVPIYDGSVWSMAELSANLSQATTDNTKSPAAVTTDSNYDLFVWNDAGTYRCTRGPVWTSDTARGTGAGTTELEYLNGIFVNKVAISNGPGAQKGTYVGTIRTNSTSSVDFIYGAAAAGGTKSVLHVWNMYNRQKIITSVRDTTDTWTRAQNTIGVTNAGGSGSGLLMRVAYVCGLAEEFVEAYFEGRCVVTTDTNNAYVGVGVDSTSAISGTRGIWQFGSYNGSLRGNYQGIPGLGSHFLQAMEQTGATTGTVTYSGDAGGNFQNSLVATLMM